MINFAYLCEKWHFFMPSPPANTGIQQIDNHFDSKGARIHCVFYFTICTKTACIHMLLSAIRNSNTLDRHGTECAATISFRYCSSRQQTCNVQKPGGWQ